MGEPRRKSGGEIVSRLIRPVTARTLPTEGAGLSGPPWRRPGSRALPPQAERGGRVHESRTGRQLTLRHGNQTAVVVELGGALRHYAIGDRAVLDGFGADDRITAGRGQLLVPWPNRVKGGSYRWNGQDLQLPLTEPTSGNAIHGLLRWTSWQVLEADDSRAVLEVTPGRSRATPFTCGSERSTPWATRAWRWPWPRGTRVGTSRRTVWVSTPTSPLAPPRSTRRC